MRFGAPFIAKMSHFVVLMLNSTNEINYTMKAQCVLDHLRSFLWNGAKHAFHLDYTVSKTRGSYSSYQTYSQTIETLCISVSGSTKKSSISNIGPLLFRINFF